MMAITVTSEPYMVFLKSAWNRVDS